jgi:hypothetical protein
MVVAQGEGRSDGGGKKNHLRQEMKGKMTQAKVALRHRGCRRRRSCEEQKGGHRKFPFRKFLDLELLTTRGKGGVLKERSV